jgi:hypothetical protein
MPETKKQSSPNQPLVPQQEQAGGCLLRLCWMLFGNIALVASAIFISEHRTSFLSGADVAFWGIALALAAIRYVDVAHCGGRTASGQPATMSTWRKYVALLGAFCAAIWAAAHAVAHFG